jgi:peptidyl-tRNA hydrolase, PTH1 family
VGGIRLVVGLGNPGPRYERTRHNAGFLVLERILAASGARWTRVGQGDSARDEAVVALGPREIRLARPLGYMNRSGGPVLELLQEQGIEPTEMLVVVDDAALPPGRLRLRAGGGTGGHNGLRSIRNALQTGDHPRLRVGIGAPVDGVDLADYVLEPLSGEPWEELSTAVAAAAEAVELACLQGLTVAMDSFNRDPDSGDSPGS